MGKWGTRLFTPDGQSPYEKSVQKAHEAFIKHVGYVEMKELALHWFPANTLPDVCWIIVRDYYVSSRNCAELVSHPHLFDSVSLSSPFFQWDGPLWNVAGGLLGLAQLSKDYSSVVKMYEDGFQHGHTAGIVESTISRNDTLILRIVMWDRPLCVDLFHQDSGKFDIFHPDLCPWFSNWFLLDGKQFPQCTFRFVKLFFQLGEISDSMVVSRKHVN